MGITRIEGNQQLPIGLSFSNENGARRAELRGDFFLTGLKEKSFMDNIAQHYQKHNVVEQLENQGWSIDSVAADENNEIVIDAYQWA